MDNESEETKLRQKDIEDELTREHTQQYNEANRTPTKEKSSGHKELLAKLENIGIRIQGEIAKINLLIRQLKQEVVAREEALVVIGKNYLIAANNFFVQNNPKIQFSSRAFRNIRISISSEFAAQHGISPVVAAALAQRFQGFFDVSKSKYIKYANDVNKQLANGNLKFGDIEHQGMVWASDFLRDEAIADLNAQLDQLPVHVPASARSALVDHMIDQIKIERLAPHLHEQFISDVTKQSVLRDCIKNAAVEERKIVEVKAEIAVQEVKIEQCKAMLAEINEYANTSTHLLTSDILDEIEHRLNATILSSVELEERSVVADPTVIASREGSADIGQEDQDIFNNIPSVSDVNDIFGISESTNTTQTSAFTNQAEPAKKSTDQRTQDLIDEDDEDRRTFKP